MQKTICTGLVLKYGVSDFGAAAIEIHARSGNIYVITCFSDKQHNNHSKNHEHQHDAPQFYCGVVTTSLNTSLSILDRALGCGAGGCEFEIIYKRSEVLNA